MSAEKRLPTEEQVLRLSRAIVENWEGVDQRAAEFARKHAPKWGPAELAAHAEMLRSVAGGREVYEAARALLVERGEIRRKRLADCKGVVSFRSPRVYKSLDAKILVLKHECRCCDNEMAHDPDCLVPVVMRLDTDLAVAEDNLSAFTIHNQPRRFWEAAPERGKAAVREAIKKAWKGAGDDDQKRREIDAASTAALSALAALEMGAERLARGAGEDARQREDCERARQSRDYVAAVKLWSVVPPNIRGVLRQALQRGDAGPAFHPDTEPAIALRAARDAVLAILLSLEEKP